MDARERHVLLRKRGRFGGTDCANKGFGPDFGAGREALRNTQIVVCCVQLVVLVVGMQVLQGTMRRGEREAAGAAVVCSMMALHAEDGAGKRGERMAR